MHARGQRETNGELGMFCVGCHAPIAVANGTITPANVATFDFENVPAESAEWLAARRGRAFMEWNSHYMLLPANVFESNLALLTLAELAMDQGNAAAAATHLAAFRKAWSSPPAFVSARIAVVERKLSSRKYQTVQKPRP